MPRSIQARAAGRGFPVWNASGQSGAGALPDSTRPGSTEAGVPAGTWTDPNADPASQVTGLGAPEEFVTGGLWGLGGSPRPDNEPKSSGDPWTPLGGSHAAPIADPSLPMADYWGEVDAAHSAFFNGPEIRRDIPSVSRFALEHQYSTGGDGSDQQPLTGPIRANAGFDAVQGYGGGADGRGGVNASMPLVTDQRLYPGVMYDTFVSASEVPFLSAEADQFIATDPYLPAWTGGLYDGPTATVRAQDPVTGDTPAQGAALGSDIPAFATSFWS